MTRRTIMVLDDHPVVLQGVLPLLRGEQLLEVAGMFESSAALLTAMKAAPPDLVVIDFQLGQGDAGGLNLLTRIFSAFKDKQRFHGTRVIVLSGSEQPANVRALLKYAEGFVGKSQGLETVLSAIRSVLRGQEFVAPELPPVSDQPMASQQLTLRERQVIRHCLGGLSTKAIAELENKTESTISTQKGSAYRKLGIISDSDLHRAKGQGLLDHLL
jgi:DNA-binding NarL/FixJ family response regulator